MSTPISALSDLCLEIRVQYTNYISSAMPVYLLPIFPALMVMPLPSETVSLNKLFLSYIALNMMPYYGHLIIGHFLTSSFILSPHPPISYNSIVPFLLLFLLLVILFLYHFSLLNTLFLHFSLTNLTFSFFIDLRPNLQDRTHNTVIRCEETVAREVLGLTVKHMTITLLKGHRIKLTPNDLSSHTWYSFQSLPESFIFIATSD